MSQEEVGISISVNEGQNDSSKIAKEFDAITESIGKAREELVAFTKDFDKSLGFNPQKGTITQEEKDKKDKKDEKDEKEEETRQKKRSSGFRSNLINSVTRSPAALAGFGGNDPMGAGASMIGSTGASMQGMGSLLGGSFGSILTSLGITGVIAGAAGAGLNMLSKQYEQFSPLTYNAQLTGQLAKADTDRATAIRLFNKALDSATASAKEFGVSIEKAGQLQMQAMKLADVSNKEEAEKIADQSLKLKNVYGANEFATLNLESQYRRFGGEAGAANIGVAMHQMLIGQDKASNATVDESLQALNNTFAVQLRKGIAGDMGDMAQSIAMLTDLTYVGSGKNYSVTDAANMASSIDQGFARSANISKPSDILAMQASMKLDGVDNLLDAQIALEGGLTQHPSLLQNYFKTAEEWNLNRYGIIHNTKEQFGLNISQAKGLYDLYKEKGLLGEKIIQDDIDKVTATKSNLNIQQEIVGDTQEIRRDVAFIAKNISDLKSKLLNAVNQFGRSDISNLIQDKHLSEVYGSEAVSKINKKIEQGDLLKSMLFSFKEEGKKWKEIKNEGDMEYIRKGQDFHTTYEGFKQYFGFNNDRKIEILDNIIEKKNINTKDNISRSEGKIIYQALTELYRTIKNIEQDKGKGIEDMQKQNTANALNNQNMNYDQMMEFTR